MKVVKGVHFSGSLLRNVYGYSSRNTLRTHTRTITHTLMLQNVQQSLLPESSNILTGIKLGCAVTSVLDCCWHLEQGEGISITQRVHYE